MCITLGASLACALDSVQTIGAVQIGRERTRVTVNRPQKAALLLDLSVSRELPGQKVAAFELIKFQSDSLPVAGD